MVIKRLVVASTVLVALVSCSFELPAARPADPYASIEELADALGEAGLCEEFVDESHRTKNFDLGKCWLQRGERRSSDFILLRRYPENAQRDQWRRNDSRGCDGPTIYGPNWSAGSFDRGEAETIIESVGGEPVGWAEEGDC